jgi:hypothetical protein
MLYAFYFVVACEFFPMVYGTLTECAGRGSSIEFQGSLDSL